MQSDWLLMLLDSGLDPIRIQKAMFLFAMESGAPPDELYGFRPYNWGPFSQAIYSDLEQLERRGLIERVPQLGATYGRYQRTAKGNAAVEGLRQHADPTLLAALDNVKATVARYSFDGLLRHVYAKYPEFAVNSVLKR